MSVSRAELVPDTKGRPGSRPVARAARRTGSAAAVRAGAEDREVAGVDGEPVLGRDAAHGRLDELDRDLFDAAALAADEVEMVGVVSRVVGRRAVAQVRVRHQAELLEELEGPVDGGDVHPARGTANPRGNLVRRGVPERRHGLEDQLPLRGEAVSAGAKLRMPQLLRLAGHPQSLGVVARLSGG